MAQVSVACNNLQLLQRSSVVAGVMEKDGAEPSKTSALSFSVGFEEPGKKPRRMPKHLSQGRSKRKPELSEATIAEKQKLAEERRKKHIEDKLEKIHQLEEEAQKLAQAMMPLIEAQTNGLPARKLHRDNDVVGSVSSGTNFGNHQGSEGDNQGSEGCSTSEELTTNHL